MFETNLKCDNHSSGTALSWFLRYFSLFHSCGLPPARTREISQNNSELTLRSFLKFVVTFFQCDIKTLNGKLCHNVTFSFFVGLPGKFCHNVTKVKTTFILAWHKNNVTRCICVTFSYEIKNRVLCDIFCDNLDVLFY